MQITPSKKYWRCQPFIILLEWFSKQLYVKSSGPDISKNDSCTLYQVHFNSSNKLLPVSSPEWPSLKSPLLYCDIRLKISHSHLFQFTARVLYKYWRNFYNFSGDWKFFGYINRAYRFSTDTMKHWHQFLVEFFRFVEGLQTVKVFILHWLKCTWQSIESQKFKCWCLF